MLQRLAAEDWRKRVGIESTEYVHSVPVSTTPETLLGLSVYSRDVVLRENTDQRRTTPPPPTSSLSEGSLTVSDCSSFWKFFGFWSDPCK